VSPAPHGAAQLSAFLKDEALRLGFCKVGIAQAEPLDEDGDRLREWLRRGYHASMAWMDRTAEKRGDPGRVLAGVRSIVSVAMNYYTPEAHSTDESVGKVSRYAWGDDYHDLVLERLELLKASFLTLEPAAGAKVYADTGPVMEKAWAEKAGLGWRGKHTNVITREFGSWVFLGELLLTVPLVYDEPALDMCGTCTLCLEACPTDALVEPYLLDSNKCISYLTIEHRGEIAQELGERFDRWIYGCDICQDVCPWNERFSRPTDVEGFHSREVNRGPTLATLGAMTDEEFSTAFKKSPVKRTKRTGLARNARIALSGGHSHTSP
jgi:epoxyqueuosine reductase